MPISPQRGVRLTFSAGLCWVRERADARAADVVRARVISATSGHPRSSDEDPHGDEAYASAASSAFSTGPESWPFESGSRSTNSITAMAALSP